MAVDREPGDGAPAGDGHRLLAAPGAAALSDGSTRMHDNSEHTPVLTATALPSGPDANASTVPMPTACVSPQSAAADGLVFEDDPLTPGETTVTLPPVLASSKFGPVVSRSRTSSVVHSPLGERVAERRTVSPFAVRSASHTTTNEPPGTAAARGAAPARAGKSVSRSTVAVSHGPPRGR